MKTAPPGVDPGQADQADGAGPASDEEKRRNGAQNKSPGSLKNGGSSGKTVDVKREQMPQLTSKVQHVNLGAGADGDKDAKKKKGCCSIM